MKCEKNWLGQFLYDSGGMKVGVIKDILGAFLEEPSYIEVAVNENQSWNWDDIATRTFFLPLEKISLLQDRICFGSTKAEVMKCKDYLPWMVMEREGYQISSVAMG